MTMTSPFASDREKHATSDFNREDRITSITGILSDFHNREPNPAGTRARAKFVLRDISHVKRASDAIVDPSKFKGFSVSYDYGDWDAINKQAKAPKKNDVWFEAIVPAFSAADIDLGDGEALYGMIGDEITFTEQRIERIGYKGTPYEVRKRGEDGRTLPPIEVDSNGAPKLDAEGNTIFLTKDSPEDRYPEDATWLKEIAWYENLFPSQGTATASSADPRERASQLLADSSDYESFKDAASKDAVISRDGALRNEILMNNFSA